MPCMMHFMLATKKCVAVQHALHLHTVYAQAASLMQCGIGSPPPLNEARNLTFSAGDMFHMH
jgi:hypothetical protein